MKVSAALSTTLLSILIPAFPRAQSAATAASEPASAPLTSVPAPAATQSTPAAVDDPAVKEETAAVLGAVTIPRGVRYKTMDVELNRKAFRIMKKLVQWDPKMAEEDWVDGGVACGSGLWQEIKRSAEKETLDLGQLFGMSQSGMSEGKAIRTKNDLAKILRIVHDEVLASHSWTIRKAGPSELSLYWKMIPFDIEEPLFILASGNDRLLVHFFVKDGNLKLFWLDLFTVKAQ